MDYIDTCTAYDSYTTSSSTMSLILTLIFSFVIFQDICGVARVKRSDNDKLRNPGTYIVHFKDNISEAQLQQFTKQLIRQSNRRLKFEAKIIAEYPNIKCLTTILSKKALKWVSINICILSSMKHTSYVKD